MHLECGFCSTRRDRKLFVYISQNQVSGTWVCVCVQLVLRIYPITLIHFLLPQKDAFNFSRGILKKAFDTKANSIIWNEATWETCKQKHGEKFSRKTGKPREDAVELWKQNFAISISIFFSPPHHNIDQILV